MDKTFILRHCLLFSLSAMSLTAAGKADYRDGVFIVNEDWYGHQNSTVNWISDDFEWTYRVFQLAAQGEKELGCTNQYGQIYGGKFLLIAKQEKDPGASIKGGRITVADARTMECLFQSDLIDPSGNQCDGRGCLGIDEHKAYISSSNGVWVFDTDNYTVTRQVEGSANPNGADGKPNTDPTGSLYHGQCGSMVRVNDRVFVAHQSEGLLVVDPAEDKVTDVISMQLIYDLLPEPENGKKKKMPGIGSVTLSKDGYVWFSVAKDVSGSGATLPYIVRVDPATLECKVIDIPEDCHAPANSWYAWTPDGFCASFRKNALYWNGGANSWFSKQFIYRYDIDSGKCERIIDLAREAADQGLTTKTEWNLYGCSMRVHPVTDRLYMSLFHVFQDPTYRLRVTDADGKTLREVDMIQNYWFPSLPVFPDNEMPEAHDPGVISVGTSGEQTIFLDGVFTDGDSMEAAIVKTVTGVSDPGAFLASIVNGNLVVTPLDVTPGMKGTVTVKANSNGETVSLPIEILFGTTGVADIPVADGTSTEPVWFTLDGSRLGGTPSSPGIYLERQGSRTRKVIIK